MGITKTEIFNNSPIEPIIDGQIRGVTADKVGENTYQLGNRGQGLYLTQWHNELDLPVITVDGIYEHIALGPAEDASIISELAQLNETEALIELAIRSTYTLNHVLANYPLPWRYPTDEYNQHSEASTNIADWADYFDPDSKEARSLRSYFNSSYLWSDPLASIDILRDLITKTDLYFAHPLNELPQWFAARDRPGGSGGDLRRYL